VSALATAEFAVTPGEQRPGEFGRLEAKLAQVFQRGFGLEWRPVLNGIRGMTPTQRVTVHHTNELLDTLAEQANNGAIVTDLTRRTKALITSLSEVGMLDLSAEVRAAIEPVRPSVAASLPNPKRISTDDALLYESAAGQLVHDHLKAGADQISEVLIRGLEEGIDDKALGERIHQLGMTRLRAHADTWARTETTRWYTLGRVRMAEEAGDAVWGYEYVVILDDRTTDLCRSLYQRRVAKDAITRFPPFWWNCRTTLRAIMAEWVTGKDPENNLLGDDARPAEGWGGDPRGVIRRATGGLP